MPSSILTSSNATVVELAPFRRPEKSKLLNVHTKSAELLSMRQHLGYQASVEIDKLDWLAENFDASVVADISKQVKALLNKEFGQLRVYRRGQVYEIRHRSVEGLISSLLRIQFYSHYITLPSVNRFGDAVDSSSISLIWGVGRTSNEAIVERVKRRRQKYRR